MLISSKQQIEDAVIQNLLSAHKRIADSGNVVAIIVLSKYLLRLSQKRSDVLIDIVAEDDQNGSTLSELIGEYGFTSHSLAEAMNISQAEVDSWMNGKNIPDAVQCCRISEIMICPLKRVYLALLNT